MIFSFCIFHCSWAQVTFQKTYGGTGTEKAFAVQQTIDGGYIMVGYTNSFGAGSDDVYLIKTKLNGDTLWTKTYGGAGIDRGRAIIPTSDSGYIVVGYTESFGAGWKDVYLIKTDANGKTLWTKTYGGGGADVGRAIVQTSDGGYIITGWTNSFPPGSIGEVYLIKTDVSGNLQWSKTFGEVKNEGGWSVRQTTDEGYIITGWTSSFGAGADDVYLIKTDSVGGILWARTYGEMGNSMGRSVIQTNDGGYIVMGYTDIPGAGSFDMYLIKTSSVGDTLWTKIYGGVSWDQCYAGVRTNDGGYILTGNTNNFDDVYLVKTDSVGDTLWTKAYGGGDYELGYAVQQTNDGGYIVAGYTKSFGAGLDDIYLIKTDANGNSGCNEMGTSTIVSSGAIVDTAAMIVVGSGAIVNSTATMVTSPSTIDSTLCRVIDSTITSDFIASDTIICEEDCINFFDLSTGFPTSWQWSFSGATPNSSTDQHPLNVCYATAGTYDVTLIVSTLLGLDTLAKINYITVTDCDTTNAIKNTFYIPNSFSLNEDGENDVLLIRGSGIKNIKLFIYNRWGEKVFESYDIN